MAGRLILIGTFLGSALLLSGGARKPSPPDVTPDLEYARVGEHRLMLDLYRPAGATRPPVIVWVHGGAWRSGSRKEMPLTGLVDRGYAIASVDYRLSPVARFPAQVHDIKAAIRYLRAKQEELNINASRLAVAGSSAGGHLASLVGVTNGHPELEGKVGSHRNQSSSVQAIISLYGMSNLTTILNQSTPHGLRVRVPALRLLLGGLPEDQPRLARLASPVFHVDAQDPPLLLFHGDHDPQAPIAQSHELEERYRSVRRPCRFFVLPGSRHGGSEFTDTERLEEMARFLKEHL
jgi:acetyl esterase/lipase